MRPCFIIMGFLLSKKDHKTQIVFFTNHRYQCGRKMGTFGWSCCGLYLYQAFTKSLRLRCLDSSNVRSVCTKIGKIAKYLPNCVRINTEIGHFLKSMCQLNPYPFPIFFAQNASNPVSNK